MTFNTDLLDAAIAKRQRRNDRDRQAILTTLLEWLEANGSRYGIDRLYIFGSLSRPGQFTATSDVDLAVESMLPEPFFEVMGELVSVLERDVGLVDLSKCHFANRIREQGIL